MILDRIEQISKKTAESIGGALSVMTGLFCAGVSVMDERAGQSIWHIWVVMSVLLVVNGVAMMLHARRRDDSPLLPELDHAQHAASAVKARP